MKKFDTRTTIKDAGHCAPGALWLHGAGRCETRFLMLDLLGRVRLKVVIYDAPHGIHIVNSDCQICSVTVSILADEGFLKLVGSQLT